MKLPHLNPTQQFIYDQEQKWFQRLQPFLYGKILKVGNGLGYMSSFINRMNPNMVILDIAVNEQAVNKNKVIVYDGKRFPVGNKEFDCSVITLVLHHTPHPLEIMNEMERASNRLIIFEVTYTGIFSKIDLVYHDLYVNLLARQPSTIYWKSYFRQKDLFSLLTRKYHIIHHEREGQRSYWKELYVVDVKI